MRELHEGCEIRHIIWYISQTSRSNFPNFINFDEVCEVPFAGARRAAPQPQPHQTKSPKTEFQDGTTAAILFFQMAPISKAT